MAQTITVLAEGVVLDQLLVAAHGFDGQSLLEEALEANAGLEQPGGILPIGSVVVIPDLPERPSAPTRNLISLFD